MAHWCRGYLRQSAVFVVVVSRSLCLCARLPVRVAGKTFFFFLLYTHGLIVLMCCFVHILCLRDTIPPSISLTAGNRRHLREAHGFYINQVSVWCVNVYSRHVNRMLSASQHLSVRVLTCHQCSPSSSVRTSLLWAFPFCLDNKANWQV